jgi:serine/threonine protein kinase
MSDDVKHFGDYEILEFLGAGGMGKVYKVRNVISDRVEAMKVLLPELNAQEELIKRFLNEIKMLATLDHPNIAALRTALTVERQFGMVMEFVEGTTLAKVLEKGAIPADKVISYAIQVLSALSYAHGKGIIHRDIKPANMMLTPTGMIKLMDFGIARSEKEKGLTTVGTTLGSIYYMAPEQVRCEAIDGRSDIYALGISLYEMVTGRKPFEKRTDYSIMAAQLQEMPQPPIELRPDIPVALNEIILVAVAKDPAERFQNPDAMRQALESVAADVASQNTAPYSAPVISSFSTAAGSPRANVGSNVASTATISATQIPAAKQPSPSSPPQPVQSQAAQPPSVPAPVAAAAASGGHRGLYMTFGALIVLAGLAVAGLYIPKMYRTHASDSSQQSAPVTQAPASLQTTPATTTTPAATPDASVPPATEPAAEQPAAPSPQPAITGINPSNPPATPHKQVAKAAANVGKASPADSNAHGQQVAADAASRAADDEALKQVEHESDLLTTRMAASDASLNSMKDAQARQGYGLRADIASAQERLHMNLSKLDAAIQSHDLKAAKRYMDLCDRDAETIDKFLGH